MTRPKWLSAIWIPLALIAVAIGVRWWMSSPAPTTPASSPVQPAVPTAPAPAPPAPSPFLRIEGTNLAGVDEAGRRLWEIQAKTLQVDRTKDTITLAEVTGQLYQAGTPQLQFAAPRGVFTVKSKDVELSGGVIGRTPDGRTLRAATVRWSGQIKMLSASGGVTVTQPGMTIRADSLTTDAGMKQITFAGNISVKATE